MIRACTENDLSRILDARNITALEGVKVTADMLIVVDHGPHIMGAIVKDNGIDCEVHILCPKSSAIASRAMCIELLGSLYEKGFRHAYTYVGDKYKKAYNLVIKLGFIPVVKIENQTVFVRQLWA